MSTDAIPRAVTAALAICTAAMLWTNSYLFAALALATLALLSWAWRSR